MRIDISLGTGSGGFNSSPIILSPTDISDLKIWLDANDITQVDNTAVSSWLDKSGNTHHASNALTASQPLYRTNQANSKPSVVFDGVDDVLTFSGTALNIARNISGVSIFTVARHNVYGAGTSGELIYFSTSSTNPRVSFQGLPNASLGIKAQRLDTDAGSTLSAVGMQAGSYQVQSCVIDYLTGKADIYVNNQLIGSSTTFTTTGTTSNTASLTANLGRKDTGSNFLNGGIAELLVYNKVLNTNEKTFIENYLKNKYFTMVTGITLNQTSVVLTATDTYSSLVATVFPANATNKNVTWTSSDTSIATVSSTGVVTTVSDGTVTITATTQDGGFSSSAIFTVNFTPKQFAELRVWLDASDLTQADNSSVSNWLDKSGNNTNVTQVTLANQPVVRTNQLNGKPVVRFDGVNDYLLGTNLSPSSNRTIIVLSRVNTHTSAGRTAFSTYPQFYGGVISVLSTNNQAGYMTGGGILGALSDTATYPIGSAVVQMIRYTPTEFVLKMNVARTVSVVRTASVDPALQTGYTIGSDAQFSAVFNGDIAEVIVYNSAISDANYTKIVNYLTAKWGLSGVSEFKPTQYANNALWFDASQLALANNATVATWPDLSGNGWDVSQSTTTAQPTYLTNQMNGKAVVRFDGVDDHLRSSLSSLTASSERSIIAVVRVNGSHTSARRCIFETKPQWYGGGLELGTTNFLTGFVQQSGTGLAGLADTIVFPLNVPVFSMFSYKENSTRNVYVNSRLANTAAFGPLDTTFQAGFNLGTYRTADARFFVGDIAEFIVFNREVTALERDVLLKYLQLKWGF